MKRLISLGKWTEADIDRILLEAGAITDPGERVGFISGLFLGSRYQESTLSSGREEENLIINLSSMDCLTFLEYSEAMRRSRGFNEFIENLKKVRYIRGHLSYASRRHFFSDWVRPDNDHVMNVTGIVGDGCFRSLGKLLNQNEDGSLLLPGVEDRKINISFIPSDDIHSSVVRKMRTGDYCGIFAERRGLDVTHAGIFINGKNPLFRHASSSPQHMKVVDEDFYAYIKDKPGIVVLRPV